MSHPTPNQHPLHRLFERAVTEAFRDRRDLYSPEVASHISEELLPDFVHVDRIYRLKDLQGRRLEELPEMIDVAGAKEGPERSLEVNRYIGDFVLFVCSFFPALVRRGGWFTPSPMVSRVGGILVRFSEPMDYFKAEGRNAYSRAARTAQVFDPTVPSGNLMGKQSSDVFAAEVPRRAPKHLPCARAPASGWCGSGRSRQCRPRHSC